MLSWLIACVLIGWLIVYNLMRIGGDSPSQAALPSLASGAAAGLVVFGLGVLALRRLHASGRRLRNAAGRDPLPLGDGPAQRDAVQLAWAPLGLLAVAAIAMGV